MRYKLLGRSGLRVSELCLGAMTFGAGAEGSECRAMFDAFAEAGGTFVDTACSYGGGRSETLLGEFLGKERDRFVVGTKYSNSHAGGMLGAGNSRRNMVQTVETSLKRLQTDRIDLLWLHIWDSTTPVDELIRAFDDLAAAGKVLYFGASNTPAWQIARANMMADLLGRTPFVAIQVEHSLLERTAENDMLPMAKALDLGITAWSPLAGGVLARAPDKPGDPNRRSGRPLKPRESEVAGAVAEIAAEIGATPAQVALAAQRQNDRYGQIIPILGASRIGQLRDTLGCLAVKLSDDHCARLDRLTTPKLIYPHGLLRSSVVDKLTTGGQPGLLDNHRL